MKIKSKFQPVLPESCSLLKETAIVGINTNKEYAYDAIVKYWVLKVASTLESNQVKVKLKSMKIQNSFRLALPEKLKYS